MKTSHNNTIHMVRNNFLNRHRLFKLQSLDNNMRVYRCYSANRRTRPGRKRRSTRRPFRCAILTFSHILLPIQDSVTVKDLITYITKATLLKHVKTLLHKIINSTLHNTQLPRDKTVTSQVYAADVEDRSIRHGY